MTVGGLQCNGDDDEDNILFFITTVIDYPIKILQVKTIPVRTLGGRVRPDLALVVADTKGGFVEG